MSVHSASFKVDPSNVFAFKVRKAISAMEAAAQRRQPPKFMNPVRYIERTTALTLDEWQRVYVDKAMETSRIAIAACRQSGKSTVTAAFAAWFLTYHPGSLVLIASKSLRQAAYFIDKIRQSVLFHYEKKELLEANKLSITLPNGATAVAIPCQNPDAGRGFSPDLVILDEAAFAAEDLLAVITPSLAATGGALHMISSPNGPQGFFFEACEGNSKAVFFQMQITHAHCPRITQEFLDQERLTLGQLRFEQEYEAKFLAPEGAFFGASALNALFAGEDIDLDGLDLEEAVEKMDTVPRTEMDDLVAALDRADRVSRRLYDE